MLLRLRFKNTTKHREGFTQQDKFVYYKDNNKISLDNSLTVFAS